jgi:hypothetical protein
VTKILRHECERLDVHEFETHRYSADASTLGIAPGKWPASIHTDLGNGMPFMMDHHEVKDGDLMWVRYHQANGCITLLVYND